MKGKIILLSAFFALNCMAQDSTQVAPPRKALVFQHEFGVDGTLLLKQVFNLSNTTFTTLPYDLTYKLICGNSALRVGFGVTMNNSSVASTITNSPSTGSIIPGPDPQVPTTTNSSNIYYRIGYERRVKLDSRFVFFYGIDFTGQIGTSLSESSQTDNNLPTSYSYEKTTDDLKTTVLGGGPVAGLQYFFKKRLSIFTEIPLYFQYSNATEVIDNFINTGTSSYNFITNSYVEVYTPSDNKTTTTTKNSTITLSLPVTLYLCFTF